MTGSIYPNKFKNMMDLLYYILPIDREYFQIVFSMLKSYSGDVEKTSIKNIFNA